MFQEPGHFYSPIVLPKEIAKRKESVFSVHDKKLSGIDLNIKNQVDLLNKFAFFYNEISFPANKGTNYRFYFENDFYSYSDGIFLFCFIQHFKPKKIIEIGSGFSSALMLDVNSEYFNNAIELSFIEPNPERLNSLLNSSDKINLFNTQVQNINLEIFRQLNPDDILFIDSSHVLKTGSDLNYLLFEVLPVLKPGVKIHFHDIFYPFEYPENWILNENRSWNECYALHSFLMYNNCFEILAFNTFLIQSFEKWFEINMPKCLLNTGGSLWLNKKNI